MARKLVTRRRDGSYTLDVSSDILDLLGSLAEQLEPLLDDPARDAGLKRLFPPAHPEDLIAEASWQIQQGDELRLARKQALDTVRMSKEQRRLNEEELISWMQGINSLRLVLAERLDIQRDSDTEESTISFLADVVDDDQVSETDRAEAERQLTVWQVYGLLGGLLQAAVTALAK